MNLKLEFYKLNKVANDVSVKLYNMYIDYLKYEMEFPIDEFDKLVDKYDVLNVKVYNKKNSGFNKLLSKINFFGNELDSRYNAPSKDTLLLLVSEKVFCQILFDANKYVPTDEESKNYIFNKLLPIVNNLRVSDVTDIYLKMKKSAIIRGFVFDEETSSLLQEMFVDFIISILSHSSYNKFNYMNSVWTPEEICMNILKEPLMYRNTSLKRVKEVNFDRI